MVDLSIAMLVHQRVDGITASQPSFITDIHVNIRKFSWLHTQYNIRVLPSGELT